jgi:hypothetical protein
MPASKILKDMQTRPAEAERILTGALQSPEAGLIGGLAVFVSAALDGVVLDPENVLAPPEHSG